MTDTPTELHAEAETPNWVTKVRCTCGAFESVSRAQQWKHAADELRAEVERLTRERDEANARGDGWRAKYDADTETLAALRARAEAAEAENERHRKANLVRAVTSDWSEERDGALIEYINSEGFDGVPWRVSENLAERLRAAEAELVKLHSERDALAGMLQRVKATLGLTVVGVELWEQINTSLRGGRDDG